MSLFLKQENGQKRAHILGSSFRFMSPIVTIFVCVYDYFTYVAVVSAPIQA